MLTTSICSSNGVVSVSTECFSRATDLFGGCRNLPALMPAERQAKVTAWRNHRIMKNKRVWCAMSCLEFRVSIYGISNMHTVGGQCPGLVKTWGILECGMIDGWGGRIGWPLCGVQRSWQQGLRIYLTRLAGPKSKWHEEIFLRMCSGNGMPP